jgi:CheY-like chemotaxis protein
MQPHSRQETEPSVSVLVIDDDCAIRETLSEILRDEGYTVATAGNGADALQVLKHVRPRLIVLDLNMPVMSGGEFRLVQRLDPSLRTIPTVVLTATDRVRERVAELDVDAYLAKPIKLGELFTVVERFCAAGRTG